MDPYFRPRIERPTGLARPVRVDPDGLLGPTRHQAAGPNWRRTSAGRYVPAYVDHALVEQRILEQGTRIRQWGIVTAWAALRWLGAAAFSGLAPFTGELLPVPLAVGNAQLLRPDPRIVVTRQQVAPYERQSVDGLWVAIPERALLDEVRRHGRMRQGVVDVEMSIAAGLTTRAEFASYVDARGPWTGIQLARDCAALAGLGCVSPQEVRMVLAWLLDAELGRPLCNVPIFDRQGRLIAIVDLLDVVAGLVGEYQGGAHRDPASHRRDIQRHDRLRAVGLEVFEVVEGDLAHRDALASRMVAARRRARFEPESKRAWTLTEPSWYADWSRRSLAS